MVDDIDTIAFSFPIGLYSQLFEPRDIPIGQQTKPSVPVNKLFHKLYRENSL
jgi:hypothetical protein